MARRPTTVCLIQDYLPPYRIPLFTKIAAAEGIDFTLLLMARRDANYAQWADLWRNPPFDCLLVEGWRFRLKSENESGLNPALFFILIRKRPDVVICSGFSMNTILAILYRRCFASARSSGPKGPRQRNPICRIRGCARACAGCWPAGSTGSSTPERKRATTRRASSRPAGACHSSAPTTPSTMTGFSARCDVFRQDAAAFAAFSGRYRAT